MLMCEWANFVKHALNVYIPQAGLSALMIAVNSKKNSRFMVDALLRSGKVNVNLLQKVIRNCILLVHLQ